MTGIIDCKYSSFSHLFLAFLNTFLELIIIFQVVFHFLKLTILIKIVFFFLLCISGPVTHFGNNFSNFLVVSFYF